MSFIMCTPRVIKSRRLRWAGYVACMGTLQNAYNISVCKPEGMIPLGRLKYRWENDTKIDLKGTGYEGVDSIQLAQDRVRWQTVLNMVMFGHLSNYLLL
jgi:hypothetical protein